MKQKLSDKIKRECIQNHHFPKREQVKAWARELNSPLNDDGEFSSPDLTRYYVASFVAARQYKT